jgi:hypothetical protein
MQQEATEASQSSLLQSRLAKHVRRTYFAKTGNGIDGYGHLPRTFDLGMRLSVGVISMGSKGC